MYKRTVPQTRFLITVEYGGTKFTYLGTQSHLSGDVDEVDTSPRGHNLLLAATKAAIEQARSDEMWEDIIIRDHKPAVVLWQADFTHVPAEDAPQGLVLTLLQ